MDHQLSWETLLSDQRVPSPGGIRPNRPKPAGQHTDSGDDAVARTAFEQDYDRIVFSTPFRRLARKTQVHPMASNDHIHNRLTHSIEVASVGRSFAARVARFASASGYQPDDPTAYSWVMQAACLIHDLGNPPFGHAGEEVIRAWAGEHTELLFPAERFDSSVSRDECIADWLNFEGNAQGFRVAARRDNAAAGYLRLTYATLGSAIKYPWLSTDPRAAQTRKHNVYTTEADLFTVSSETMGLVRPDGIVSRHPLSFLTEAADDICYRLIDMEDAVEMQICDRDWVTDLFVDISRGAGNQSMGLAQLRGLAVESLIDQCWGVFTDDAAAIMAGDRFADLKAGLGTECTAHLAKIKDVYIKIFGHRKKVATELGAYHVLGRVLKSLVKSAQSVVDADSYDDVHFLSKRCVELTWGKKHVEDNLHQDYRWWLGQVMDFSSGMTDDYATSLSREIGGYSLDAS